MGSTSRLLVLALFVFPTLAKRLTLYCGAFCRQIPCRQHIASQFSGALFRKRSTGSRRIWYCIFPQARQDALGNMKCQKRIFSLWMEKTHGFTLQSITPQQKSPHGESDDWRTPLALLAGEAKLSRICDKVNNATMPKIAAVETNVEGTTVECVLKDQEGNSKTPSPGDSRKDPLPRVFLEILPHGELSRIVIQSSGSVLTEFRFKDWEINPPPGRSIVSLQPTSGRGDCRWPATEFPQRPSVRE